MRGGSTEKNTEKAQSLRLNSRLRFSALPPRTPRLRGESTPGHLRNPLVRRFSGVPGPPRIPCRRCGNPCSSRQVWSCWPGRAKRWPFRRACRRYRASRSEAGQYADRQGPPGQNSRFRLGEAAGCGDRRCDAHGHHHGPRHGRRDCSLYESRTGAGPGTGRWQQGLSVLTCPEGARFPCMPGVYDSAVPATRWRNIARRVVTFRLACHTVGRL